MELIILIVIVLVLLAVIPTWPYSQGWGYNPAGLIAAVLLVFLVLWLLGVIDFNSEAEADANVLMESMYAAAPSGNNYS